MIGPEGIAKHTADYLRANLPARLRVIENRLDLAEDLPDPALVAAQERGPLAIEQWPAVFVLPQRSNRFELVDVLPDAGQVYRVTYRVQIVAWVRHADGYAATSDLARRYALAIREAMLVKVQLGDPALAPAEFAVAPSSLTESYSDVLTDEGRTIAGITLELDVITAEALATAPIRGTVAQVAPQVDATLPQHPAL